MQAIIWIFFLLFLLLGLSLIWYTWRYGISPMPTSPKVKKALFNELPTTFTGTIYELGSGWGNLAFSLAEKYSDAQVVGFEISWGPYLFAKLRQFFCPKKNLIFKRADFLQCDLSKGNFYLCYLYPAAMRKLHQKLSLEAPKGAFLVSHTFAFPGEKPIKIVRVNDLYLTPIYFYLLNNK